MKIKKTSAKRHTIKESHTFRDINKPYEQVLRKDGFIVLSFLHKWMTADRIMDDGPRVLLIHNEKSKQIMGCKKKKNQPYFY